MPRRQAVRAVSEPFRSRTAFQLFLSSKLLLRTADWWFWLWKCTAALPRESRQRYVSLSRTACYWFWTNVRYKRSSNTVLRFFTSHWIKVILFFFFLYWRYNPLWVLAFSVIFFHSALFSHCFLHRLTPIICKSSSMPAIHLFRGLSVVLVPTGFHCNILLGVLLSTIRITRPSQAILLLFSNFLWCHEFYFCNKCVT